jgi:O-antigen ligase
LPSDESISRERMLALSLVVSLCLATLILWIPAYWPVALFEISAFAIAGICLIARTVPEAGTRVPLFALSFLVLWGCFQLLIGSTVNRFATERAILQWMTLAAVYYAGVSTVKSRSLARFIRVGLVWFAFALTLEAVLQAYLSPGLAYGVFATGYHDFVMGPIVYHTHFAVLIETILPLALSLALERERISYTFLGVAAFLLTGVVVSASRGGLIITAVEVLVVFVLFHLRRGRTERKGALGVLALIGVTAALVLIVGYETTSERFATGALTAGRLQFAISTLHMIAVHPLTGWGLGCWPAVYPAFATFDAGAIVNEAHTDWLQWTAEGGLPAGFAMLSLAIWAIRPAVRSIWGIGVMAIFIHAAFDYPFSRPAVGAWPFLILAMAAVRYPGKDERNLSQGKL